MYRLLFGKELLSIVDGLAQQVNSMSTHLGLPPVVEEDFMATSCRRFGPRRLGTNSPSPVQSRPLSPSASPGLRSWNLSHLLPRKTSKEGTLGTAEEQVEQPRSSTPMRVGESMAGDQEGLDSRGVCAYERLLVLIDLLIGS